MISHSHIIHSLHRLPEIQRSATNEKVFLLLKQKIDGYQEVVCVKFDNLLFFNDVLSRRPIMGEIWKYVSGIR